MVGEDFSTGELCCDNPGETGKNGIVQMNNPNLIPEEKGGEPDQGDQIAPHDIPGHLRDSDQRGERGERRERRVPELLDEVHGPRFGAYDDPSTCPLEVLDQSIFFIEQEERKELLLVEGRDEIEEGVMRTSNGAVLILLDEENPDPRILHAFPPENPRFDWLSE